MANVTITSIVEGASKFCKRNNLEGYKGEIGSSLASSLVAHDYLHYRFGLNLTGRFDDDEITEELVEEIQDYLTNSRDLNDFYEFCEDSLEGLVNYKKITKKEFEILNFVFNRY